MERTCTAITGRFSRPCASAACAGSVLDDAVRTADESGRPLRDILVAQGAVTEVEVAEALAEAYGLKTVDLVGYPLDVAAAAKIPIALSRRHRVLGIAIDDEEIVVATADPGDVLALDDVRAATGLQVSPVVVARDELNKAIDRFQRAEADLDDVAASLGVDDQSELGVLDSVGDEAPDRPLCQRIDRAGDREPGVRPASRADRARVAGPVPHRRRAARGRHRAARRCSPR